jgi:hypothetical protein
MTTAPSNLRTNLATWTVPPWAVPAVSRQMLDALPPEVYDPDFLGQYYQTTYFDSASRALRKARLAGKDYLTLRLRAYSPATGAGGRYPPPSFTVSAKTTDTKFRSDIKAAVAAALLVEPVTDLWAQLLPPDLFGRLLALVGDAPLTAIVTVCCTRYAVEDDNLRLTLDTNIGTDTGKCLPFGVLEFKALAGKPQPPGRLPTPGLRPLKLSKFLWATDWR